MNRLRLNVYAVVQRAVEEGVATGLQRAHKHADAPSREHLEDEIERAVMNALCEVIEFEDEHHG